MAQPDFKPSDPSRAEIFSLSWLAIAVGVVPLAGWLHLQRYFCPPDALLAGYIETTLGPGSAFAITGFACVIIFFDNLT